MAKTNARFFRKEIRVIISQTYDTFFPNCVKKYYFVNLVNGNLVGAEKKKKRQIRPQSVEFSLNTSLLITSLGFCAILIQQLET